MPTSGSGVRREHVEAFLVDLGERRVPATVATRAEQELVDIIGRVNDGKLRRASRA